MQYLTYKAMAEIESTAAFKKSLTDNVDQGERQIAIHDNLPGSTAIWAVVRGQNSQVHSAALALQWCTAARFIDLHRIKVRHLIQKPECTLIVYIGGKTDRRGTGQGLMVPNNSRFLRTVVEWGAQKALSQDDSLLPGLNRAAYNAFLMKHLRMTSHKVRHAALTEVASKFGEEAAVLAGRHKNRESTRRYIPMETWAPVAGTRSALSALL
ncbi:hypothetical protein DIPPA_25227 [Diplonema papillatum]|nr:hypothetical protein DIPPA_08015 [Diplonema papillatum]KAJ9448804.1 hypothetical protein DIPPA_30488 [Diplonema papillatum]KAJ9453793.1 hypothetical protein DIPPA_26052 [Diplonema papillatum]KAJ9460530.1 hypothetical protein DIPPA_25227 [Diplonema papillatum]